MSRELTIKKVNFSIGRTINLGNYQSLRLDVGMEAETTTEDYGKDLNLIKQLCASELRKMVDEIIEIQLMSKSDK